MSAPKSHCLCEGIEEDERAVTIVYKLDETAVHHLFSKDEVSQQGRLLAIQKRQSLSIHLASNAIQDCIVNGFKEGISALNRSFLELYFLYVDVHFLVYCATKVRKLIEIKWQEERFI